MRIAALLVLLLTGLTGCLVVPAKTTTTRKLGVERSSFVNLGVARGLTLETHADHSYVIVTATRTRDCQRKLTQVTEVTEDRHLHWSGVDDPRGAVFAAPLAVVTVPLSFLYSAVSVSANPGNQYQTRKVVGVENQTCTEPASHTAVEITLASGTVLTRETGEDGGLSFTLPAGEPYQGVIVAKAGGQTSELKYHRKMPAVTNLRTAVTSCAQQAVYSGPLEVRVAVNPNGYPTKIEVDHGGDALTTCIATRVASSRFPEGQRDQTLVLPFSLGE